MPIERRRFMTALGALGLGAVTRPRTSQSSAPAAPSYEEVRSKLAGTKVFIVPYAHNDYGWLNSNLWDRRRTPLVHREALELMRREPDFKWFFDVRFEALDWFTDLHPDMLPELEQRVAEGRWGIAPGSFCNPDNPFMEAESMIRNLVLGRRDFERTFPGVNLEAAVFNDIHPGHSQVPQILRQAGYRFYRITRPVDALDKKGYKREFVWRGIDGSEILFSYGPYGFGALKRVADINRYGTDWKAAVVAFYESAVADLLPGSATGLIYSPLGGDYTRPLRAFFENVSAEPYLDLPGFVREWARRETVPLVFATPIDYFRELDKVRSGLPRVEGIVDPIGWPFWYGSCGSQGLDNWRERNTRDLVEAEIFSSLGAVAGAEYPAAALESLWYDKLTLDPHDGLYVGDGDVMDLIQLARHVEHACRRLRERAVETIARRIAADPAKQSIALFNPLDWRRREVVEIDAVFPTPGTTRVRVLDPDGRPLAHQLLKVRHMGRPEQELSYKEARLLVEAEIPATGYTTLTVEPQPGREEPAAVDGPATVLESDRIRLRLGPGGIESFEDRARGVRYAGAGNPVYYPVDEQKSWQYHGGPVSGRFPVSDARWTRVEEGPLRSAAEMKGRLGSHTVELRVSLYHTLDRIDCDLAVESQGGNGYLAANVAFDYEGSLFGGVPFGAESRDLSREPFGTGAGLERMRENVFYAHHWVDYSDGRKGLTLLAAEGKRGFRFEPRTRSLDHILLMTIVPRGEMETRFANRFFRGTGRHVFRYSLLPHGGGWQAARSLARAQEPVYPVRWRHVDPRAGADLPLRRSFLTVAPETVAISAWFWREGGHHLRLYESAGEACDVEVALPFAAAACERVDLNGRPWPGPRIDLRGDSARFRLRPWEIVTLRFSPARARS
jgi:alpha-mannosidase